jgi:putative acetyltransferase
LVLVMAIIIREEIEQDVPSVRQVEVAAFDRAGEADLVDKLRWRGVVTLSLVALDQEKIVGHVLFSPGYVSSGSVNLACVGMGPVAVLPEYQRQGIGTLLIEAGLMKCFAGGAKAVFVLGNPAYYSRFGFVRSDRYGIRCEFDAPPQAFMLKEADKGVLSGWSGVMHYQPEFREV